MHLPELDHESPIPLYHQLAEALRYRIATGGLAAGTTLPPLRRAALLWKVNLHTVRRAYAELATQGMVSTRGASGTRVLPTSQGSGRRDSARERFLARIVREAREKHGLEPAELGLLLQVSKRVRPSPPTTVYVVECSRTQCEDLAAQLEKRWQVTSVPWPLQREDPPGGGVILATYFHYNDIRVRLPGRTDVRFVATNPDPGLRVRLQRDRSGRGGRTTVILCEREEPMARNIAADLRRILPPEEFEILIEVASRPQRWLERMKRRIPVLFAPRVWGALPESARNHPRVHEVRYVFDPKHLEAVGLELGWQAR
jgi:DNA-binding transcriptional regulator YhcF (GntR family)